MPEQKKICSHVGTRGGNADVQCKNRAKLGDYCVKHKKREKANLANDEVLNDKVPKEQNAAPNEKFSVFRFTLNSQKDYTKMTTEEKTTFKNALDFVFNEADIVKFLIDRTNPEDAKKNINKLKIDYYLEVGETQGRLHTHGVIDMTHTGNYQLDIVKIRALFEKLIGKNIYFNASASGNAEAAWNQYITKSGVAKHVEL